MKGVSGYEKQISCIWVDYTVSFTNPKSCFAYAQGTTESTTNSTEQKETVASSTKPSAATSAPSSSSNNEDKTAEKKQFDGFS